MKKILILFVAVMLALPAMSYAGSATSRWDLTIGGMVKFDLQWADQAVTPEVTFAERKSDTLTSSRDNYNALTWASGETRLNFLVKGPDTWGAKTSAFIEGDFRRQAKANFGSSTSGVDSYGPNTSSYGDFGLRHAFMKFDWPTFSLVMGSTWTLPGALPCFCLMSVNELGPFNKSYFIPQIYGVWQATKEFSISFGAISPTDPIKNLTGTPAPGIAQDDFQRSQWPMFFSELVWKSDACGKIGPWMLQFGLGGFYGKEKPLEPGSNANTPSRYVSGAPGTVTFAKSSFETDEVDMWMATFKTYIPIIPEKAPGKLAGSLGLALTAFTGQNVRTLIVAPPMVQALQSYDRAGVGSTNPDFVAPVYTGGWGQLSYYFTDTVWSGFYYGQGQLAVSQARKASMPNSGVERIQQYVVNLVYDPNPAIRLGLEYSYITTHYGANFAGLQNEGNVNLVHFGASYFF